eukprot:2090662-Prymnesium_polylepis.1
MRTRASECGVPQGVRGEGPEPVTRDTEALLTARRHAHVLGPEPVLYRRIVKMRPRVGIREIAHRWSCLLYTSDAADDM